MMLTNASNISQTQSPIYILGDTPLAFYLASRFQTAGEKVTILGAKIKDCISVIEGHNLRKNTYQFDTSSLITQTPKLLIICSEPCKLNSALTTIPTKKILNTPVVLFSYLKDTSYVEDILSTPVSRGYFDGYLEQKQSDITLLGRSSGLTICSTNKRLTALFTPSELTTEVIPKNPNTFWDFFGSYAVCSIIATAFDNNIFEVIKDRHRRDNMIPIINEVSKIAQSDGAEIDTELLLKKIYNTPLNYSYPMQLEVAKRKASELNLISSNLQNIARQNRIATPQTNKLLHKIYNKIYQ